MHLHSNHADGCGRVLHRRPNLHADGGDGGGYVSPLRFLLIFLQQYAQRKGHCGGGDGGGVRVGGDDDVGRPFLPIQQHGGDDARESGAYDPLGLLHRLIRPNGDDDARESGLRPQAFHSLDDCAGDHD